MAPLTCECQRLYCTHGPETVCSFCGMTQKEVMWLYDHPKPLTNDKIRKPIIKYRADGKLKNRRGNIAYYK